MRVICFSLKVCLCLLAAGCVRSHLSVLPDQASSIPSESPVTLSATVWPGKQPDGSVLLPNQWSLRPAGRQIELRDFPVNMAVHPRGRYVAVLHCGYSVNVVTVVDLVSQKIVSHANIDQGFYGLEFSADGGRLFCS